MSVESKKSHISKVIAIYSNQKGAGKTTLIRELIIYFKNKAVNKKILLVDCNTERNLSHAAVSEYVYEEDIDDYRWLDVASDNIRTEKSYKVINRVTLTIDLFVSDSEVDDQFILNSTYMQVTYPPDVVLAVSDWLSKKRRVYDLILMDFSSGLNMFNQIMFGLIDEVIFVSIKDEYALPRLKHFKQFLASKAYLKHRDTVRDQSEYKEPIKDLQIAGYLLNLTDNSNLTASELRCVDYFKEVFGNKYFGNLPKVTPSDWATYISVSEPISEKQRQFARILAGVGNYLLTGEDLFEQIPIINHSDTSGNWHICLTDDEKDKQLSMIQDTSNGSLPADRTFIGFDKESADIILTYLCKLVKSKPGVSFACTKDMHTQLVFILRSLFILFNIIADKKK